MKRFMVLVIAVMFLMTAAGFTNVYAQAKDDKSLGQKKKMEKCYGLTKLDGKTGKTSTDPNKYIYVDKGICEKMGGTLAPPKK